MGLNRNCQQVDHLISKSVKGSDYDSVTSASQFALPEIQFHWYPCFGFLVTFPLGFKARVGSALFAFCGNECNVHSLRSTSGATCADLLAAGIAAGHFLTCICRGGTWLRFEQAITCTKYECATIVPATRLEIQFLN